MTDSILDLKGTDPLSIDIYPGDNVARFLVHRAASAGAPWHMLCFKASEGLDARWTAPEWFKTMWRIANGKTCEDVAARVGTDLWSAAYHYLHLHLDGAKQAEHAHRQIIAAGGYSRGTAYWWVDVEEGTNRFMGASARQAIDCTSKFAERMRELSGRPVVLYCGWWLRGLLKDAGLKSRMGCEYILPAAYTSKLDSRSYTDVGFDLSTLFGWQYCGDGTEVLDGYPGVTPLGPEDIAAITVNGGGARALEHLRRQSWPEITC